MNRFISFLVVLSPVFLVGCGDNSPNPPKFAFIQQLPNGQAKPFSVTPLIGSFGADGMFSATNINDPATGKPMDMPIASVFLSSDGKKIVFDLVTDGVSNGINVSISNIATANFDGSGFAQLTNNSVASNTSDSSPQFSPDGKQIVFVRGNGYGDKNELWLMNADGSNRRLVRSFDLHVEAPSFSPDGRRIVARADDISLSISGIVTMNVDGSSITQISGIGCSGSYLICANPTFTSDGKQVSFASVACSNPNPFVPTVCSGDLEIMNADGSNVTNLQVLPNNQGVICDQPRDVGSRLVFTTNRDHWSPFQDTNKFELYSIMPDGSKLTRLTNTNVYNGMNNFWLYY